MPDLTGVVPVVNNTSSVEKLIIVLFWVQTESACLDRIHPVISNLCILNYDGGETINKQLLEECLL